MSKKRNPWKICVGLPQERRTGGAERGEGGGDEEDSGSNPRWRKFRASPEPAKTFLSVQIWTRVGPAGNGISF